MTKDMEKICSQIEAEIKKISERGLTSGNIDTAYKLIDMYKDLKTVEGMEEYSDDEYSQMGYSNARGREGGYYSNAGRGPRYMHGNYSRAYGSDYGNSGYSRSDGYKGKLVDTLQGLMRDADSKEERDMIEKYMHKIEEM